MVRVRFGILFRKDCGGRTVGRRGVPLRRDDVGKYSGRQVDVHTRTPHRPSVIAVNMLALMGTKTLNLYYTIPCTHLNCVSK